MSLTTQLPLRNQTHGAIVQFAVSMLQVVGLRPGERGVPVMLTPMELASSAEAHAFFGAPAGALPLYSDAKAKFA